MRLTMKEKQSVIAVMQERYRKAGKKLKRQILDERCRLTGYNRAYASHLLCHYKPALKRKAKAQMETKELLGFFLTLFRLSAPDAQARVCARACRPGNLCLRWPSVR